MKLHIKTKYKKVYNFIDYSIYPDIVCKVKNTNFEILGVIIYEFVEIYECRNDGVVYLGKLEAKDSGKAVIDLFRKQCIKLFREFNITK